ncbi:merozoite surface antigen, putative, partial [Perkinsus marinus ATCC 50983]
VGATADRRPHTLADTSISSPVGGVHPPVASGGPVSPVAETMKSSIASPGVHAAFTGPNYSPDATPSPPPAPHHEQQPKTEWDASPSVQIPGGPLSVSAPSNGVHPPTAGPTASVAAPSPQNTSSPAVSSSSAPPQPVPAAAPVAGYDDHKPDTTMQSAEASPLASPPSNGVPAAFAQPARFRPAPKRMPQARRQRPHPVQGATDPFASLMQVTGTAGGPARVQNKAYSGPPPPQ